MAKSKFTKAQMTTALSMLATIAAAGEAGMPTEPKVHEPLAEAGFVEIHQPTKDADPKGIAPTRITQAGFDKVKSMESVGKEVALEKPKAEKATFVLDDAIPVPARTRGGNNTKYPFDDMAAGQSFFVPVSEDMPNPARSLSSPVSGANKRYKETDPVRKFAVRKVTENNVEGARVWRIQ